MAQINDSPQPQRRRPGITQLKKHHLKTDMTPMVDLGFLLIAFFVMTTEMSKPNKLSLNMPADGIPTKIKESTALTVLLTGTNMVYYYHGDWNDARKNNEIYQTELSTLNGIGKVIREKQNYLESANISKEGREGLMLMIKAGSTTKYDQVINMLDETIIHKVSRYVLLSQDTEEEAFVKDRL